MGIAFDGEFTVPASPNEVMDAFADVPRMAALMPGAFVEGQEPDGAWRGGMVVAFGPKKIRFNGKVTLQLDRPARSGSMVGRGSADMRAARVETHVRFDVKDAPGGSTGSVVTLSSNTAMTGVLAEFARSGGPVVARLLMEQFAQRLRDELAAPQAGAPALERAGAGEPDQPGPAAASTVLRAQSLVWPMLRRWLRQLTGRKAS